MNPSTDPSPPFPSPEGDGADAPLTEPVASPADALGSEEKGSDDPLPSAPARGERVLLLEDDAAFQEVVREFLTERGYAVTAVHSGVDGIEMVLQNDFAIVVCDMLMPGLPGDIFYRAVERARPELCHRFIFMTGLRGDARANKFLHSIQAQTLTKPFSLDHLLNAICAVDLREQLIRRTKDRAAAAPAPLSAPAASASERTPPTPEVPPATVPLFPTAPAQPRRQGKLVAALLGLVVAAGFGAWGWIWHSRLVEDDDAATAEVSVLQEHLAIISQRAAAGAETRPGLEERIRRPKALQAERAGQRWTPALGTVATATRPGIAVQEIEMRGEINEGRACELRVGGLITGPNARLEADRFRLDLEARLGQRFGAGGGSSRFARLEEILGPNDQRSASFLIVTRLGEAPAGGQPSGKTP